MDAPRLPIGGRIAYYRTTNGNRTQAAVAGLCGISERYLSLIENGARVPSAAVLSRLAAELGVPVAALLAEQTPPELPAPVTDEPAVARALMGYGPARSGEPVESAVLRERVERAWRIWQTSTTRFTGIAVVLPALIVDVEHAVRVHRDGSDPAARRDALRTSVDLYGLLRSYCRRVGRLDLSLMVADRAVRAAEDADDPVRIAAASWNLGHVLLSDPRDDALEEAADIALNAVSRLDRETRTPRISAIQGALELVAVVAAARHHQWWNARARLAEKAVPLAREAGEGNVQHTVFGPTNVELHALSIEMLAGESAEALRVADEVDTEALPSRERQFTFTLEVARCYAMRRDDAAVLVHLLALEELSPEDLSRSPTAITLIAELRRRVRPTYRRQVDSLAERLHIT
ncbi:transcriptional regulator [Streptomyces sp. CB01201]|uniref:helix-turn-helix domain-containing protein n=1 Tax=Streptomyces sp. CB01201 TaxID=2020324 RepID=UPI000C276DEB|nr:helix-turn-helix transcriptional regulator [Streptomyces sp. CB01201]PJN00236.1 transcriptional regulator [Streptomyces sp. CB01201]